MRQARTAPLWAAYVGPRRALWWAEPVAACTRVREAKLGTADVTMGREVENDFIIPVNLLMLIQISFQAKL